MKFVLALLLLAVVVIAREEELNFEWDACSSSGDPHYKSFHGKNFDFQGTGWVTYFKSTHLNVLAYQDCCGACPPAPTQPHVTCLKDMVIDTDLCSLAAGCGGIRTRVSFIDGKAWYQFDNGNAIEITTAGFGTRRPLSTTASSVEVQWSGSQLEVWGGGLNNANAFWITVRRNWAVIRLRKYGSYSPEGEGWGSNCGICGMEGEEPEGVHGEFVDPDCSTASTVEKAVSWNSQISKLRDWGVKYAVNDIAPLKAILDNAIVKIAGHIAAAPITPALWGGNMNNFINCIVDTPLGWWDQAAADDCRLNGKPFCLLEGAVTTDAFFSCLYDWLQVSHYAADRKDTLIHDLKEARLAASAAYFAAITPQAGIMVGLLVGCGLGLVFIVGAVAFFAKNPELLPFTHKKAKVMKELATSDVLPK